MAEQLFYALLTGVALGAFYDFLRLLRLILNRHFLFDLLFWTVSAFAVYSYLLIFNNGSVRAIYLLFISAGYLLYIFTLGYADREIEKKTARLIKIRLKKVKNKLKSFKKVLQSVSNLYYNVRARLFGKAGRRNKDGNAGDSDEQQS